MRALLLLATLAATAPLPIHAQWSIQNSGTTADLRGIAAIGDGTIAWASGTNGTVLSTEDAGHLWQHCTIPPGAEKLDFRGIQAFDANTAIVMSSGPGDLSRLYKTTDGCQTWKLVFTNPDKDGFFDALRSTEPTGFALELLGDPVNGSFPLWTIQPTSVPSDVYRASPRAKQGEAAFAASNTALFFYKEEALWFATGGRNGAHVIRRVVHGGDGIGWVNYASSDVPVGQHTDSSGVFSLTFAVDGNPPPSAIRMGVAVGGDYLKPADSTHTAGFTTNGGKTWKSATTQPHGYRSAVAYIPTTKTWITVGPNGTDISTDDGRNWQALHPAAGEATDADRSWNALSLPFVVGPHGRIGILNPAALTRP
jgi:hypothetical protein